MTMTREEAIAALKRCPRCKRWITTIDCDHCWVDAHRCPPTVSVAIGLLDQAIKIGTEAEALRAKLRGIT